MCRTKTSLSIIVFLTAFSSAHADSVTAAAADILRIAPADKPYIRYFDLATYPADAMPNFVKVFTFHVNSISTQSNFWLPVFVTPTLLRIDIRDVGWSPNVWEKLAPIDPYYHIQTQAFELVMTEKIVHHAGGDFTHPQSGRVYRNEPIGPVTIAWTERVKKGGVETASAPWLDTVAISTLIKYTQSSVPIVRADWFFVQSARQLNPDNVLTGAGYYDFLGLKSRNDIFKLIGLDREISRKDQYRLAAIIKESGVAINNRQIYREGAQSGGYWFTLDVENSKGRRNAVRQLGDDFTHDAEEAYFVLPNGLFGLAAIAAADGKFQDSVPDKIASDHKSSNNDLRVHPGLSCIRCHVEGLRPIKDYSRQFYSTDKGGTIRLQAVDHKQFLELQSLYLRPLEDSYERDNKVYADALHRLTGKTPSEMAKMYAQAWSMYQDTPLTLEDFARELGCSPDRMVAAFKASQRATGNIDAILGAYLKNPAHKISRPHAEEVYGLAKTLLNGFQP